MKSYQKLVTWYNTVTWFGIFLNMLFVIPFFFFPAWSLKLLGIEAEPNIWARISVMLLFIITVFYIPVTRDLKTYRIYAWLGIIPSRFCGSVFFFTAVFGFGYPMGFLPIAIVDGTILILQLTILLKIREVEQKDQSDQLSATDGTKQGHSGNKSHVLSRRWVKALIVVIVLVAILGTAIWYKMFREVSQLAERSDGVKILMDDSAEEYFKYGSIGAENAQGTPYWIWMVLPRIFPEYLPGPGGYNSLGMLTEPGRSLPVGISRKTIGFDRIALNCAFCHAASVRLNPGEPPEIYAGGPAHTFDVLGYQRFLFQSAKDPRFNTATIMAEIGKIYRLSAIDKLLYRMLIPLTKRALIQQAEQFAWTDSRPDWGRGRIDPFNPVKVAVLDLGVGNTIGNSDMVPIWNLGVREGMDLHWDGMNNNLDEIFNSSAIGDGATPKSIPLDQLQRLKNWLKDVKPPPYPFPIDVDLAERGKPIYQQACSDCHDPDGSRTGKVIPLEEVGTDRHRVQMWTAEAADAYNSYADNYPWSFSHWKSTNGYVAMPLDGVWIRGPFLHNGSVPTLEDLLETPQNRPQSFYRGYDLLDREKVGFVSKGPQAERVGFFYDTSLKGNSNQGHLWGTELTAEEKRALVEYMKTL